VGIIVAQNDQALASLVNSMSQSGAIGALPAAATVIAGSFYYDTTNSVLKQEQGGAWVDILEIKTLNAANEIVAAGYYAATTLSAVDADLAVGNIKKDEVIFGFTGTHQGLSEAASEATLGQFGEYVAIGNVDFPERLNDGLTVNSVQADIINEFAQVTFSDLVKIKRWRQFGDIDNAADGEWKIQYWNVVTDAWVDWVTGIPTRATADWSNLATEAEVVTTKIRLVATALETDHNVNNINELEVYF